MFHISHPWALYHAWRRPAPAVGSVRSWSPVLKHPEKRPATNEGMSGMDVLVFPSMHPQAQGIDLGFSYPVPTMAVRNALASAFVNEDLDLDQTRRGVVFVGSTSVRLGLDLLVIEGCPLHEVRSAMLSGWLWTRNQRDIAGCGAFDREECRAGCCQSVERSPRDAVG